MAFSKTRSITPFSLSSVSMVRSVTCFISWLNFWGVSLFRMLRTFLNSSCVQANRKDNCWLHQPISHTLMDLFGYTQTLRQLSFVCFNCACWCYTFIFALACVFCISGSSGSSSLFIPGFQAFSDFFSWISSLTDTFMMIFLGGGRRAPMFMSCECS